MIHILKSAVAAIVLATLTVAPAMAGSATKSNDGNSVHCEMHSTNKTFGVTTGEKAHCVIHLTQRTKQALIEGGGAVAASGTCTALGLAIVAAGGGPEDPITDAVASAAAGACEAALVTAAVVGGESCKGAMDVTMNGKGKLTPPDGYVHFGGHLCR